MVPCFVITLSCVLGISVQSEKPLEKLGQCLLIQQCFCMVYECNNNYTGKVDLSNEGID